MFSFVAEAIVRSTLGIGFSLYVGSNGLSGIMNPQTVKPAV